MSPSENIRMPILKPRPNNYFSVETFHGRQFVTFDDRSELSTRDAYVAVRRISDRQDDGADPSFSVFRPVVWKIEAEMGIVGRLKSIRHAPDPTVRGAMRLFCNLCGVSVVVRDVNPGQRDRLVEVFEETHAQHWIDEQARLEQVKRVYAANHAKKKRDEAA